MPQFEPKLYPTLQHFTEFLPAFFESIGVGPDPLESGNLTIVTTIIIVIHFYT